MFGRASEMATLSSTEHFEASQEGEDGNVPDAPLLKLSQANARRIVFNDPDENKHFVGNHIR